MEVIVWSSEEKYEKSTKKNKPILNSDNEIMHNVSICGEYIVKKNNRENIQKKEELQERKLIRRNFQNPFLEKNYLDVIDDQDKFLIPQNSNIGEQINLPTLKN